MEEITKSKIIKDAHRKSETGNEKYDKEESMHMTGRVLFAIFSFFTGVQ